MKRRSRARALCVLIVLLVGSVLALPNFFPSDPVLQISSADGTPIEPVTLETVRGVLADAGVEPAGDSGSGDGLFLRFDSAAGQRRGADVIAAALPNHVVAFTSQRDLPAWLERLGLQPVSLGLDLRGGVRFVYEVDLEDVTQRFVDDRRQSIQADLREQGIRHSARIAGDRIHLTLEDATSLGRARDVVEAQDPRGPSRTFDIAEQRADGLHGLVLRLREEAAERYQDRVMTQNVVTLRNRVDELGLSEPVVTRAGFERIDVQIPGARDPAQVRRILSSTATIEWRLEHLEHDATAAARAGRAPPGSILRFTPEGEPVLLRRDLIATGENLDDARFAYSQGSPVVTVTLDRAGADRMFEATRRNVGRPLGVLLIEETREAARVDGEIVYRPAREESVIFLGRIADVLSSNFELTGVGAVQAQELAVLLRSGALAAPIYEVRHGTVGPTLGRDNVRRGRNALVVGFLGVVAFMAAYYRTFGWIANCALAANLVLLLGLLSVLPAALTLPGIAGVVLTVGMAVDANVLIFERIRESRGKGNSPYASIDEGYRRAFSTIADANVTTLIAAAVLFMFGAGPVKGFAATLGLGVLTSMFTSIVGTRALVDAVYGGGAGPARLASRNDGDRS